MVKYFIDYEYMWNSALRMYAEELVVIDGVGRKYVVDPWYVRNYCYEVDDVEIECSEDIVKYGKVVR